MPDDAGDISAILDHIARLQELAPNGDLELGLAAAMLGHVVVQEVGVLDAEDSAAS